MTEFASLSPAVLPRRGSAATCINARQRGTGAPA